MRKTIYVAVAIWIVCLLLSVPDLVIAHVKTYGRTPFCDAYHEDWGDRYKKFRTMFRFIVLFACPLVVISVFYSAIVVSLQRRSRECIDTVRGGEAAARQLDSRRKVLMQLLLVVVLLLFYTLGSKDPEG